jgi:hypothetical protein
MLNKLWKETKEENRILKEALQEKEREICNIRERLNEQEQYTRSWCVRVLNMKMPQADSTDPLKVMQNLYDRLLLPIFRGALEKGLIKSIPPVDQILEKAHILPCKPDTIPPHHHQVLFPQHQSHGLQAQERLCPQGRPGAGKRDQEQKPWYRSRKTPISTV